MLIIEPMAKAGIFRSPFMSLEDGCGSNQIELTLRLAELIVGRANAAED